MFDRAIRPDSAFFGRAQRVGRQLIVWMALVAPWVVSLSPGVPRLDAAETSAEASEKDSTAAPANRNNERQIKVLSGLAALCGILIAGLSLIVFILIWAARLRRQLRRPLPEADPPGRDFWFLKPPRAPVTTSSLPEANPTSPPPDDE